MRAVLGPVYAYWANQGGQRYIMSVYYWVNEVIDVTIPKNIRRGVR